MYSGSAPELSKREPFPAQSLHAFQRDTERSSMHHRTVPRVEVTNSESNYRRGTPRSAAGFGLNEAMHVEG